MAFPIRFRGSPCDSAAFHTGHFPIGFAALPYNHTPDASPHTSRQIPIGWPFSHSHGRSPIARPSPHTIHNLLKVGLSFDETSGSCPTNPQPTTSSKHPEPALQSSKPIPNRFTQITWLQSPQISRQPSHANATDLRLGGAVTSCMYGHGHIHSRVCARPSAYLYMHGHSRAHLHWHAHICTAMAQANSTRPAYGSHGSSANPTHSNALRLRNISADQRVQPT